MSMKLPYYPAIGSQKPFTMADEFAEYRELVEQKFAVLQERLDASDKLLDALLAKNEILDKKIEKLDKPQKTKSRAKKAVPEDTLS